MKTLVGIHRQCGSPFMVLNEMYDADTEMRRSKQRLETFGRDVRAVTTTSTV